MDNPGHLPWQAPYLLHQVSEIFSLPYLLNYCQPHSLYDSLKGDKIIVALLTLSTLNTI
jgi:hypothetical protein